jgi:putative membrane protein
MKTYWKTLLPVCLMIALQSCGNTEGNSTDTSQAGDSISDTAKSERRLSGDTNLDDKSEMFVLNAANGGLMEVEAAGLARKKSKDKSVKDFAEHMLKDHGMANQELEKIARDKGVKLAKTLPEKDAGHLTEMNTLADRAFDVQYMRMMINDHEKSVQLFTHGSHLADPELKAFTVKTLPVIEQHFQTAVEIGKRINISNANNGDDLLGQSPAKIEKN